jgi:Fic family protein
MDYQRIAPLPEGFTDAEAASVDSLRDAWIEQRDGLAESGSLERFNQRLVRRWSIETGIIERLYTLDRGTTELLVQRGLDTALVEHGSSDLPPSDLITILTDHEQAASAVVDHVAQKRGLTNQFVRALHQMLTQHQDQTEALDQFGNRMRVTLRRGVWKDVPNNPRRPDGIIHPYCPPLLVQEEMDRLIKGYSALDERRESTIVKTAWLHHRFTQIHPFQDGNGRVARAIAAFVLINDGCFPIVVDRDTRDEYVRSLEMADGGDLRPLVRLFARLEKREIEQALSLSQDVIDDQVPTEGAFRAKLLTAFRDRVREKRAAVTAKRRIVIETGDTVFDTIIVSAVESLATDIGSILASELPGSEVRVERSGIGQQHFFKRQLVEIARREGYFGDFETIHRWVRLRLQRPAESDADITVNEIVISLHSLGRHFNGVLILSAYFATRMLDEANHSVTLEPKSIADRSLTFSYRESKDNVAERVREWTGRVLDTGLAELLRTL